MRRLLSWIGFAGIGLCALLCTVLAYFSWQARHRESRIAIEVAPATGHFANVGDTVVFFQTAGAISGRPVLLIHGTGAWSEIWRETMTALAASGFQAVAIDLPPFGYSGKPTGDREYSRQNQARRIIGLLDALHIAHAIVVGHSVGARPAMEAALESPERVDTLVLVDPALGFASDPRQTPRFEQNHPSWFVRAFFGAKPVRNSLLATYGTNPLFTRHLFSTFVSRKDSVNEARVQMLQQPLVVEGTTNAYGDWLQYLLTDQDTSLASDFGNFGKLTMPVFVVWGAADSVTPLWQGQELVQLVPHSQLAIIDAVGHIPYVEAPQKFNDVLIRFLAAGHN
jgi:pimeloyl-ACP methyl ester carboxylesterase